MRATAAGSLPGTDFAGALRFVLETFSDTAPWPELPDRGPGSAMVGRAAALLADLPVELTSSGWQLSDHTGIDGRRARAQWRNDLDDLEEVAQGYQGAIKIAVCGPLTLAARLGRLRGEVALSDSGARREIAQSLDVGLGALMSELGRRLPMVRFGLQIDEPGLPAILAGQIRSVSGYRRLPPVDLPEAVDLLRLFASSGAILHCCASGDIWTCAAQAGFSSCYLDLTRPDRTTLDQVGAWLEADHEMVAGLIRTDIPDQVPHMDGLLSTVRELVERLAVEPEHFNTKVQLAPACGLATWQPATVAALLKTLVRGAELATEALTS